MQVGRRWTVVAASALVAALAAGCASGGTAVDASGPTGSVVPLSLPTPGIGPASTVDIGAGLGERITPSASSEYLGKVASLTKQANTGQFSLVAEVTGGTGHEGTTTLTSLEGAFDKDAGKTRIKLDTSGAEASGDPLAGLVSGPIEMIVVGTTGYLKMSLLGSDGWTKIDNPDESQLKAIFDIFKVEDVAAFVDSLSCAGTVTEVGPETVDQVDTTHYRADVDTAKLATCRNAAAGGQLLDNFGDATSGTVDVWVDEHSLVRKIVNTADERALGTALAAKYPGGTATLTMTFNGFGDPVTIDPPPEDQVSDGLGGLGGLGDLGNLGF